MERGYGRAEKVLNSIHFPNIVTNHTICLLYVEGNIRDDETGFDGAEKHMKKGLDLGMR